VACEGLMAKSAGCQASYLSRVLQEKVHLTEDQAIGITEFLALTDDETYFFLLLLRYEKAGTLRLKKYLRKMIELALKEQHSVGQRVKADRIVHSEEQIAEYFISWVPSAVHLLASSEEYKTPEQIAKRLNISSQKVRETLSSLKKMGLVNDSNNRWSFSGGPIHVPKESNYHSTLQTHRRQLSLNSISYGDMNDLHFSSLFTLDRKDFEALKALSNKYIEKSHDKIKASGAEELFCICLDLFEVK
jgi:uncharacterized protein (TIGR02147 family)